MSNSLKINLLHLYNVLILRTIDYLMNILEKNVIYVCLHI